MTEKGDRLGSRYMVDSVLGTGSMGQVWLAHDQNGSQFAVKMLHPHLASDPDIRRRFFNESQILTSITHPAVVRVRDVVMEGETLGIVMEYVEGPDLATELKEHSHNGQRMQEAYASRLGAEIADGLAAIHAAHIAHRDVKPANVLLTRKAPEQDDDATHRSLDVTGSAGAWHPKITDFGVSKILDRANTDSTAFAGTPNYVSPEIILGRPPTPASDLYSFGVMLYEMVAGRTPFTAPSREAVMHAHVSDPPARPDDLSDRMWHILSCCLAKDPAARPASAAVLARELRRLVDGEAPGELVASPDAAQTMVVPGPVPQGPIPAGPLPSGQGSVPPRAPAAGATYVDGRYQQPSYPRSPYSQSPFQSSPGSANSYRSGSSAPSASTPGTYTGQYQQGAYQPARDQQGAYQPARAGEYPASYPNAPAARMAGGPPQTESAQRGRRWRRWVPPAVVVAAVVIVLAVVFSPIGPGSHGDAAGTTPSASPATSSSTSSQPSSPGSDKSSTATVTLPAGTKACSPTVAVGGSNTSCPFAEKVAQAVPADHGDRFDVKAFSPTTNKAYTLSCTAGQYVLCTKSSNNIEVYVIK